MGAGLLTIVNEMTGLWRWEAGMGHTILLNDLLDKVEIDPKRVLVLRHRPYERELNKVFKWIAADKPKLFNAYQSTQGAGLEAAMATLSPGGYLASFIGHDAGQALFVGLYQIGASKPLT